MKKLILSALFIGFGVYGFSQNNVSPIKQDKKFNHIQKLKEELDLSDVQVSQLEKLQESKIEKRKVEMIAKKEDRVQKKKQHDEEMQKILTPEQFKKLQEMRVNNMSKKNRKFKDK